MRLTTTTAILATLTLILSAQLAEAEELTVSGTYQGENIYVKNPFAASGVGFCAYEVTVNGMITTDEINSSAFEVDLTTYNFKVGDDVSIVIRYKRGCVPMVLNATSLQAQKPAKFESVMVKNGVLTFKTSGETGPLPFVIEQFRWNKWVKVGEVQGKGHNSQTYEVTVRTHTGPNKFRVRQTTGNRKVQSFSKEAVTIVPQPAITFKNTKTDITFSGETMYELYDQYGSIVFKGYGKSINIATLANGRYYLNYDNSQGEFNKK